LAQEANMHKSFDLNKTIIEKSFMREELEIEGRYVCPNCIRDSYIKRQIKLNGTDHICDYCEREYSCYTIVQVADLVEYAFKFHYERTSNEPNGYEYSMSRDEDIDYEWERSGEQSVYAIQSSIDSIDEVAEDIQTYLKEKHYDQDEAAYGFESEFEDNAYYQRKYIGDESWQIEWNKFELTLRTESRYFNKSCIDHLESIFGDLIDLRTSKRNPVIALAGPGTIYNYFYRARVFNLDEGLKSALESPVEQFGPPPAKVAPSGRMNAHGISVFYGANNQKVALAEVRPPVGSKVVVARFELTRELRLLDLGALQDLERSGSIFDEKYGSKLQKATFLENLSKRIVIPVMPGSEDFDYITTQAIADFLASNEKLNLDGILYPSVQSKGKSINIVLFHKASRVQELYLPVGGKIEAELGMYGEDGWEPFYRIIESIPSKKPEVKNVSADLPFDDLLDSHPPTHDIDTRLPSLKIDLDTIEVHEVESVRYKSTPLPVHKYKYVDKSV